MFGCFMNQKRAPLPMHYSRDLQLIVESLLEFDPKDRPTIDQLLKHRSFVFHKKSVETQLKLKKLYDKSKMSPKNTGESMLGKTFN